MTRRSYALSNPGTSSRSSRRCAGVATSTVTASPGSVSTPRMLPASFGRSVAPEGPLELLPGARVLVVDPLPGRERRDLREVVVGQAEVEDVEVLAQAVDVAGLRDHH